MAFLPNIIRSNVEKQIAASLSHDRIYSSGIPTFETLKRVNGVVRPYVIKRFYLPDRNGVRAVSGARNDQWRFRFDLLSVAGDEDSAYTQGLHLLDKLVGYTPAAGAGEFTILAGTPTYVIMNTSDDPAAYVASLQFQTMFGPLDSGD